MPLDTIEPVTLKNGKTVLVLMATLAEYLENLKVLVSPTIIGVGPVESAANTALALSKLTATPDYVLLIGSSGSATLVQGAVYQATSVSYRDMDASVLGFEKGCTPFVDQPAVIALEPRITSLEGASLDSGANIVLTEDFQDLEAQMVDMETFAVKRVCQMFGVPLIALRGISDGPEELKKYEDWTKLLPTVDKNLASAIEVTFSQLSK